MKIFNHIIFLQLIFISFVVSQPSLKCITGKLITITREFSSVEVTPEEGKKRALDLARAEAIKQVVGLKIFEETFRNVSETMKGNKSEDYFDTFSQLSRSTAFGKIVNEKVQYSTKIDANGTPIYTATLDACVVEEKANADPAFTITLTMDKPVLIDRGDVNKNDALQYSIKATQPCYIYLFNLLANDSVQLLIPNEYVPIAYYDPKKKEQEFEIQLHALNAKFIVQLPDGKSRSKEALYVIALKDNVPVSKDVAHLVGGLHLKDAMQDIMQWLVQIPAERRTEAFQSYEIRRK